jgi:DNA-binding response OmpR family regulator
MSSERNASVLIVDDEETTRRSLADILRLEGYEVTSAPSGEAGVAILRSHPPDLMLLDLKMPGMDGLEVLKVSRQVAPDTLVILLTAHGSLESAIEAIRQDAYDYLLKPSSPKQILATVAAGLAHKVDLQQQDILRTHFNVTHRPEPLRGKESPEFPAQAVYWLPEGIEINLPRREISIHRAGEGDQRLKLTPSEAVLLKVFLENQGQVLAHKELVRKVQGYEVADWEAPEMLRPLVSRLRHKLAQIPNGERWIANVRGTGYLFEAKNRS